MQTLIVPSDFSVQEHIQFEYFEQGEVFSYKKNKLAIAAGFIAWDYDSTPLDDPSIGELKFIMKSWGVPGVSDLFTELSTHYCTQEELNDV